MTQSTTHSALDQGSNQNPNQGLNDYGSEYSIANLQRALYPEETTCLMIDHGSTAYLCKQLNTRVNYLKLRDILSNQSILRDSKVYMVSHVSDTKDGLDVQDGRTIAFLEQNEFDVTWKEKRLKRGTTNEYYVKGNIIAEMAADLVHSAHLYDHIVLMSTDNGLVKAVELARKSLGKRVTLISSTHNEKSIVSRDLKKACTHFVELKTILYDIAYRGKQEIED